MRLRQSLFRVNDLQAPNMSVKKFSAKLRADSGGNGSKLAGLVNVLPRYFPSLEVLELNVRAEVGYHYNLKRRCHQKILRIKVEWSAWTQTFK